MAPWEIYASFKKTDAVPEMNIMILSCNEKLQGQAICKHEKTKRERK